MHPPRARHMPCVLAATASTTQSGYFYEYEYECEVSVSYQIIVVSIMFVVIYFITSTTPPGPAIADTPNNEMLDSPALVQPSNGFVSAMHTRLCRPHKHYHQAQPMSSRPTISAETLATMALRRSSLQVAGRRLRQEWANAPI